MHNTASYHVNGNGHHHHADPEQARHEAVVLQLINCMKFGYLDITEPRWEWPHVHQAMHRFHKDRPLDTVLPTYNYVDPSEQEIRQALQTIANINPRLKRLDRNTIINRWPAFFHYVYPEDLQNHPTTPCLCDGGPRHAWYCPTADELGT